MEEQAGSSLTKVLAICIVILLIVGLLLGGAVYAKRSFAERRENITFRELARSNAAELERREELLTASREREREFLERENERREIVRTVEVPGECVIPDELWDLL